MKRLTNATILTFALLFAGTGVFAQTSDYQVKEHFEQKYENLKVLVQNATSTKILDSLKYEIENLQYRYEDRENLLDKALYPDSFEGEIAELKQFTRSAKSKLMIIEDQSEKLASLSDKLSSYQTEVQRLNSQTDSLRIAIRDSENSERDLSALVQRYRESMQQRDEYVLNMIDSLFMSYKEIEVKEFKELANSEKQRILQDSGNPLQVIQTVIDENIMTLKANRSTLQTEDFLRIYVIQNRFDEVWDQIGADLVNMYGGDQKTQWKNSIENKLSDWNASASKNMWASIDQYLEENEIQLGAFDNNESFYSAIESFVNQATHASQEKVITDENYEDFQAFYDIWNTKIKSDWGKFVQEGEVLTMNQISTIDSEMMSWKEHAQPRSFLIPILFGLSLLTIIGLIIVIARR